MPGGPETATKREKVVNETLQEPMTAMAHLSEENLRIHNAACPDSGTYSQARLIREDISWTAEHESYRQIFGHFDDSEDGYSNMHDGDIALRRAASLDALKVYAGAFTPLEVDPYAQMAKEALDESHSRFGDLERQDLGQLVSELAHLEVTREDTRESSMGSPRPSSDTLSVSRHTEIRRARKERAENRKRMDARRRGPMDDTKVLRLAVASTAK
ncbi:hypothetical protein K505DRAFT_375323 [Melanomma pulvis-pyrius CBS 109.77]|uniref:Uncharacterized protein n=1 Tax=Melanomma pulvis-pyrius CBS 109.77 TaxID=1314802 RepID=A0A6A6XCQ9_9PLEO|nr:hypothetical protein K505DRAFT_375323 [Melanomma pulvis-pyrius CBS 109.77]